MERIDATRSSLRFVPVLEVEPYRFSTRPVPDVVGARTNPAVWDEYFHLCMADAGFQDVSLFEPGSCFVALAALAGHPLLKRLVLDRVKDTPDAGPLSGGLSLVVDERAVILPACCGDLGALAEWERAMGSSEASLIWRGHPQVE